jgi:hypothetical protein
MHTLRLRRLDLIGGDRSITFRENVSVVRGSIATGKTTLVRLLRAALGSVPHNLPPEARMVHALRFDITLDSGQWQIYRPLVTTDTAKVEMAQLTSPNSNKTLERGVLDALRLPAVRSDVPGGATYIRWLLNELGLPYVEVPRARTQVTSDTTPVTINDWMSYCIIPGDEIDTYVFGNSDNWKDSKRRYVFELIYGLYDVETANLQKELREVELNRAALMQQARAGQAFLQDTAFANPTALRKSIVNARERLMQLDAQEERSAQSIHEDLGTIALRDRVATAQERVSSLQTQLRRTREQIRDLHDLHGQLRSQSARLTRAIVADEWLVDFDFIVCPRCGNKVDPERAPSEDDCYLCLQPMRTAESRDSIVAEQERVAAQVRETDEVLDLRELSASQLESELSEAVAVAEAASRELERQTRAFVSNSASALTSLAAERERLHAEVGRAEELLEILHRQSDVESSLAQLETLRERLLAELDERSGSSGVSERHIQALERRFHEYLEELHIPVFGDRLTAAIDRRTLLPVVSGRRFDQLSSQGLEVLVNVAHSLAHHTVAIDRKLPLPTFLVLDGLSSNVGREGFDAARVDDMYRLILRVAETYPSLQVIAVDNDPPHFMDDLVVLELDETNKLIRTAA